MDLTKLVGQHLVKISQSSETGHHIIEFAQPPEVGQTQIIELGTSSKLEADQPINDDDATKILEVINFEKDNNAEVSIIGNPGQQFSDAKHHEAPSHIVIFQTDASQKPDMIDYSCNSQPILRFSSYGEFKRALNDYEAQTITKFILRNQSKQFTAPVCLHDILRDDKKTSELPLIRWEFCASKDFLPIPFMGIPYITVGKQVFQCHQGKDYNTNKKQQYELKKEILNQATRFQIKSRNKGPSKKLDCPVLFAVRKMYLFPEYPLESDSKRNRALVAQKIRARLAHIKKEKCECVNKECADDRKPNDLPGRVEYLTKLPGTNCHNHDVSKAANFMKLQLKKLGTKGMQIIHTKKSVCLF